MIIIFQLLFFFFSVFAIFSVWKKRKEGLLGPKGAFFWIFFWLAANFAVIWPNNVQKLAAYLGIGRGSDLAFYISIVAIFYILFRLNIKIEGMNRGITKIVRERAIARAIVEKNKTENVINFSNENKTKLINKNK